MYFLTFILILSNVPLFNGATVIEMILRPLGVDNFSSQGDTGLYYPTVAMLMAGVFIWLYLRKLVPNSKFSKDYFYYSFGMMVILAIAKTFIE